MNELLTLQINDKITIIDNSNKLYNESLLSIKYDNEFGIMYYTTSFIIQINNNVVNVVKEDVKYDENNEYYLYRIYRSKLNDGAYYLIWANAQIIDHIEKKMSFIN